MKTTKEKVVICLAGLTGSGKSTAARQLAQRYELKYVSGGTTLMELALEMGYKATDRGWWETPEGMRFLERRLHDSTFDQKIDRRLLEYAEQGNVVLDSWTMPWLSKKGFNIWLEVSPEKRAERLAKRDGIGVDEAERVMKEKDSKTRRIYEHLYGFELGDDLSPFDLILDTELLSPKEVFETLSLVIERLVLKQSRLGYKGVHQMK